MKPMGFPWLSAMAQLSGFAGGRGLMEVVQARDTGQGETLWKIMENHHGKSWKAMENHGKSPSSMGKSASSKIYQHFNNPESQRAGQRLFVFQQRSWAGQTCFPHIFEAFICAWPDPEEKPEMVYSLKATGSVGSHTFLKHLIHLWLTNITMEKQPAL